MTSWCHDRLNVALLGIALFGLISGLVFWLVGQPDSAAIVGTVGVVQPRPKSTAAYFERLLQMSRLAHSEVHMVHRIGWLRAAVLGANDGLVSTASLVVGVAAAGSGRPEILIAGLAGLVAGAMSMAAGEYVSVSSQTDAEKADIARETRELNDTPEAELEELTRIYVGRGLDEGLARQVAIQLTEKDPLGAHSRDELGISETVTAHPIQAALVSAATFAVGAVIPLIIAALVPAGQITLTVAATTLLALSALGGLGASVGGAGIIKGAIRVTFWGALAMAATAAVGMLFGVTVG